MDSATFETVSEFLSATLDLNCGSEVILDEAGQLGAKQMQQWLSDAQAVNGRLIASGDTNHTWGRSRLRICLVQSKRIRGCCQPSCTKSGG